MFHGRMLAVGVLGDGVLVEAEVDLGREEDETGRPDGIDRLCVFEEDRIGQPAAARVAGQEDALTGDAQLEAAP